MRPFPSVALSVMLGAFSSGAALKWEQRDGYRAAKLDVAAEGRTGFTLLSPEQTGINFTNQLGYDRSQANQNLLNGAGLAAGDVDGDGLCDLYFCNVEGSNGLFRNKGDWTFENITRTSNTGCAGQTSRGAVLADVDGDGDVDLIATALSGPNALLMNDGKGNFTDATAAAGLTLKAGCHSAALADVDGDGDLDLYIANNGEISILRSGGAISVRTDASGKSVVTGRHGQRLKIIDGRMIELGEPDGFYLNNGNGTFARLSWTDGRFLNEAGQPLKAAAWDQGLSVMFRDITDDGHPDIYVCNDFQTPDRIWINDGAGKFRLIAPRAVRTTCHFSMGVDFADIDRDGDDDFFVSDMLSRIHRLRMRQIGATNPPPGEVGEDIDRYQARRNTLQFNRGDGTYAEIANFAGVDASDWTWTVLFLDVDLDGYEDLLVANGHAYDTQDLDMIEQAPAHPSPGMRAAKHLRDFPPLETPNYAFRNRGNRTFEEVGAKWGFDSKHVSHGISLADLDNDGDQDVAVSCLWKAPLIYRNNSTAPRIAVRLRGKSPNTQGIGAKIKVLGGAVPEQTQEMISGGRYLSGDDPMRVFAAGSLTNRITINVTWRNGRRSVVKDALPNFIYEIDEMKSEVALAETPTPRPAPLFKDVSESLDHHHTDSPFNDFERQPLLHRPLSRGGPGVAMLDLDGSGLDDVVISPSAGTVPGLYFAVAGGRFTRAKELPAWTGDDLAGLCAWSAGGTNVGLLAAVAGYESQKAALVINPLIKGTREVIERGDFSAAAGPIATADIDGDGDLDLFIGGSVIPGKYPEAAPSRIYRNDNGYLKLDAATSETLKAAGLVNGAVFSDLSGDGTPELILACEWGSVRVFAMAGGKLTERTGSLGLAPFAGWWMGVTTGDFDGDGRMDIVAGNWGLNSSYRQPTAEHRLHLYYGDFDGNGSVDLIEAYSDPRLGKIVQRRDLAYLSAGLPLLRARFTSHVAFSEADLATVLGKQPDAVSSVSASTLATMVFLNRTNRFEAVPLPDEAQFAPVFGINVADFDGDGDEDIFVAQNYFAMRLEEPRLDAGRGLWLKNDGAGRFTAASGQESGINIYGEQRGSAVGDFDGDARADLVVTQNGGQTKLYRNERAKPGLRVRLEGGVGNPYGIGATLWVSYGARNGPAREIHGGSGYWSQDTLTPVLGTAEQPTAINVRWPGGHLTKMPVSNRATQIRVQRQ